MPSSCASAAGRVGERLLEPLTRFPQRRQPRDACHGARQRRGTAPALVATGRGRLGHGHLVALAVEAPRAIPVGGRDGQQRLDHRGIELRAGAVAQLLARMLLVERAAIGAVGGHRVPRVGDGDDAARDRDLLTGELVRIAAAVPALMMAAHRGGDARSTGHAGQRLGAPARDACA